MRRKLRSHLTYANVMATIAVFFALGGGLAWALANNSVKSKHIVNGQVKPHDLQPPEAWHEIAAGSATIDAL